MRRSLLSLSPLLLTLAASAVDQPVAPVMPATGAGLSGEQQAFWNEVQAELGNGQLTPEQLQGEAAYAEAHASWRKADFISAEEQIQEAIKLYPTNQKAQELREQILAVLSNRSDRLAMAATWFHQLQDVKTQELAVRLAGLMTAGDRQMAAGEHNAAELNYDRVEVGLRTFPYSFDWGDLPAQVAGKRTEARAASRKSDTDRSVADRQRAEEEGRAQAERQEQALKAKVEELISRAQLAMDRKDYRRAEVDAWNAYELDRRRDDARKLYLKARREGHVLFDDDYRPEVLERGARVQEEIHKSLIPQSELLVYPEDWKRRALRKPRELGQHKTEAWVATLNDRLEQRVTFDFQDQSLEDVIAFLRQVTGVNIVVAPQVLASGPGNVTLKVKDMRFRDALKWILELTTLKMALQDQAIYISNEAIAGSVVLRMYDVTDLISPVQDFPGKELAYSAAGGGGAGISLIGGAATAGGESTRPDPQQLVDFIRANVAPTTWDTPGVGIEQRAGSTLFVSQTPEVHALIEGLMAAQRNLSSLQVQVNVRLLDVRKTFFEEIGFDWRTLGQATDLLQSAPNGAGYIRQNDDSLVNANVSNAAGLPGNATNPAYRAISPAGVRGLQINGSMSPFNFLNVDQVNMVFTAVEEESDSKIVNHPSITCFNGQRANASFITQYAYIADYEVVSDNLDPKIEVLSFGDIIDVRPVVSSDRKYITMEIRPSSVSLEGVFTELITAERVVGGGGDGGVVVLGRVFPIELPNVKVRTLRTSVLIPDKASLLIGGFSTALNQTTHVGIPFLSHIPFLGRLFSRNGTYDQNRKLMYLLNSEVLDLGEKESQQ